MDFTLACNWFRVAILECNLLSLREKKFRPTLPGRQGMLMLTGGLSGVVPVR